MRVVRRVGAADWVVVASGEVDGDQAAKFARSFVRRGQAVICEDEWGRWRYRLRKRSNGAWEIEKIKT
jgi:hypothetical protein